MKTEIEIKKALHIARKLRQVLEERLATTIPNLGELRRMANRIEELDTEIQTLGWVLEIGEVVHEEGEVK